MELSPAAYHETAKKMHRAGYDHVFGDHGEIDMYGIAVVKEGEPDPEKKA